MVHNTTTTSHPHVHDANIAVAEACCNLQAGFTHPPHAAVATNLVTSRIPAHFEDTTSAPTRRPLAPHKETLNMHPSSSIELKQKKEIMSSLPVGFDKGHVLHAPYVKTSVK